MKYGHEYRACFCPGERLRAETYLASDNGRPKVSLGPVVMCRDSAIGGPRIEPLLLCAKNILNISDAQMHSLSVYHLKDLISQPVCLPVIGLISTPERMNPHCLAEQWSKGGNKPLHLLVKLELFAQVFHGSQEMGITILDVHGKLVVPTIAVKDKYSLQGTCAEYLLRYFT